MMKDHEKLPSQGNKIQPESTKRRTVLKALAGVPIISVFGVGLLKKIDYKNVKKTNLTKIFGLDEVKLPTSDYGESKRGALIRIGIVGFGTRANALARGLGFMHPNEIAQREKNNTLNTWLDHEDLNVAITGICDVFDLHAEKGLKVAAQPINKDKKTLPVKRYRTYEEMLKDPDIDAIVISTPDHHHAWMAIEAVKANKHVYLEKTAAHSEKELNELYNVVKNSNAKFQLGHQITQSAVFAQAKDVVNKNVLGKITLVECTTNRNTPEGAWIRHLDSNGNPKPGDEKTIDWKRWLGSTPDVPFSIDRFYNWTKWFAYDSGMIGQLFSHEFDAVNNLLHLGIPKTVSSSGGIYYWKDNREIPDSLHCVFEYPDKDITLMYSGNLASSRNRGRVFMGHDASMELGSNIKITVDADSTRYEKAIALGEIDTTKPMLTFNPNEGRVDAITSASELYYANRGLTDTVINGRQVDVTHLHLREWIKCIREDKTPSANIDIAFETGIACLMAQIAYVEKRQVRWDEKLRKII